MSKRFIIKIYEPISDTFIKIWENAQFKGFTKQLNGGLSPCEIELGEVFDYEGTDLRLNRDVRILVSDGDTQGADEDPKLIYRGYISKYTPWTKGGKEGIKVDLLGYYTKLSQDVWKSDTATTFDYDGSATDVGVIFKAVMDRYIAETSNQKIFYSGNTIKETGTTTEYKFEMLTYREAFDTLKSLAPANWFWYVDENGIIHFRTKPTSATHTFIFGKHFEQVRVERSMEKIRNAVLFFAYQWDGSNDHYKLYTDDISISKYGRRLQKVKDSRIKATTDADKIAEKFIAEHKDPDIKVVVNILDNNESDKGYDIESINPGDTCDFKGFDESLADIFKENMLITKVEYSLDKAIITIEPMKAGIVKRTEDINKRVDSIERENVPATYAT